LILQGKYRGTGDFLRNEKAVSMTGMDMMNLAKKRVLLRNSFKRHLRIYPICVVAIMGICSPFGIGYFWPIVLALSWGIIVALHGVCVNNALSDSCSIVSDEYNRLKRLSMMDG